MSGDRINKVKNGMDRTVNEAESMANEASKGVSAVLDGARDAAQAVGDYARDTAKTVADTAVRATERVGAVAGEAFGVSKEAVESAHAEIASVIRKNPITAIAVCFGIGFILGRGISRT